MAIEEIVAGLKEQGLDDVGIESALKDMLENGEITQEDYDKALAMLAGGSNPQMTEEEKEDQVFGKI